MKSRVISVAKWFTNKSGETVYKCFVAVPSGEVGYFACPEKYLPKVGEEVTFTLGIDSDCRITARRITGERL